MLFLVRIALDAAENWAGEATVWHNAAAAVQKADPSELSALATTLAIAAGIAIAWYKLDIFREFEPHLTITQTIISRPLGVSYALVAATATLTNSSKVQVKPRRGYCRLMQTSPFDDSEVVAINRSRSSASDLADDGAADLEQIGWPLLYEVRSQWQDGDISIEPGEQHQETYQFIVDRGAEAVVAVTVIYNPLYDRGNVNRAESWRYYTFHDLLSAYD